MHYTQNIIGMYADSPQELKAKGACWYQNANISIRDKSIQSGHSKWNLACTLALLSPIISWEQANRGLNLYLKAKENKKGRPVVAGTNRNRQRAWVALTHPDPRQILSGNKVTAFAYNLFDPTDHTYVTIDRWAWRVATGKHSVICPKLTSRQYQQFAVAYHQAARYFPGVSPLQVQATTWLYIKHLTSVH